MVQGMARSKSEKKRRRKSPKPKTRAVPLRTWLVLLMVMISGLGLVGSTSAVYTLMRSVLYQRIDEDLYTGIDGWAKSLELPPGMSTQRLPSDYAQVIIPLGGPQRVVNGRGSPPDIAKLEALHDPITLPSVEGSLEERSWRAMATLSENGSLIVVAKSLDQEKNLLRNLNIIQAVISVLTLVLIAVASYYFVRRAMRPLREVEATAQKIAEGDLDLRVPEWPRNTEVGQLSYSLNIMLGQLQDSVEEAQQKEAQMRRFVGDASHELRTPLTSLTGFTELYRQGATDDVDFVLGKIDDESKRMKLLVEDLLALTRAEGSRLNKKPIDLLELSLAVMGSARAAFPERSINVENATTDIPVALGDPDRMHQILLNLVVNALKHGGKDAEVEIVLRDEEDTIVVDVRDNGIGMSEDVASHIFERFYRADSSRTRGGGNGGSGLGLAIVKSLVEQHDGTISVTSEEGVGSTFTVSLPRASQG